MKQTPEKNTRKGRGWLLFFYSIPSRPVRSRMKIWRRLSKAGAVQLRGAVYILPLSEEHFEFFQWLVSEVSSLGGEAAFTRIGAIDSIKDEEIMALFAGRQEKEYQAIGRVLDDIETKINSMRKGSKAQNAKALPGQVERVSRHFEDAVRTDFFSSGAGVALRVRIAAIRAAARGLAGPLPAKPPVVTLRKADHYKAKTWASRRRPFVDRIASAWLIRRFIDSKAKFIFTEENDLAAPAQDRVTFDVSNGEFTHLGDLCTFEVLAKSFGIRDRAVRKIAEIVHELDIRDDKYRNPETRGLEEILSGLRKSVKDDNELLEKGIPVFEMLYQSKAG